MWSPDSKKISYIDNSWSLYILEVESGTSYKVASEPLYGPGGVRGLSHSWSQDSGWLAYSVNTPALIQRVFVFNLKTKKSMPITDGMSEVGQPVFDASGKYLYFVASTDAGPVKHWFAQSNNDMEASNRIYVAVLQDDGDNPLAPESDEEEIADDEEPSKDSDKTKKKVTTNKIKKKAKTRTRKRNP